MKKITAILSILLFVPFLFATDISYMLESAKENSLQYQSILKSKSLSDRMLSLSDKGHGTGITVSVTQNQNADDVFKYIPTSSVTVSLPKLVDDLEVKLGLTASQGPSSSAPVEGNYLVIPNISIAKTFNFADEDLSNSSSLINTIKAQTDYEKSVLMFESSVIKDVVDIMDAKSKLKDTEKAYSKDVKNYENSILFGQIDKDSLQDLLKKMDLETEKSQLESARLSVENMEKAFEHNYGFKFEEVNEIAEYNLSFTPSESGNSDVYLKKLALLSATYNYNKTEGINPSLKLDATLSSPMEKAKGQALKGLLTYNTGLTFESGNLSLKASAQAEQGLDGKFSTPRVTVSGTWGKSESIDLNKDDLEFRVLEAQNAYDNALYSYRTSAAALEAKIRNFEDSLALFEIQKDYHKRVLDSQTALYNKGYISQEAYQEAKDAVLADSQKDVKYSLQGLLLEIEIKSMEL